MAISASFKLPFETVDVRYFKVTEQQKSGKDPGLFLAGLCSIPEPVSSLPREARHKGSLLGICLDCQVVSRFLGAVFCNG